MCAQPIPRIPLSPRFRSFAPFSICEGADRDGGRSSLLLSRALSFFPSLSIFFFRDAAAATEGPGKASAVDVARGRYFWHLVDIGASPAPLPPPLYIRSRRRRRRRPFDLAIASF